MPILNMALLLGFRVLRDFLSMVNLSGHFPFSSFKEIIDKEIAGAGSTNYANYTEPNLQSQCDETGTDQSKVFKIVPKDVDVSGMIVRTKRCQGYDS